MRFQSLCKDGTGSNDGHQSRDTGPERVCKCRSNSSLAPAPRLSASPPPPSPRRSLTNTAGSRNCTCITACHPQKLRSGFAETAFCRAFPPWKLGCVQRKNWLDVHKPRAAEAWPSTPSSLSPLRWVSTRVGRRFGRPAGAFAAASQAGAQLGDNRVSGHFHPWSNHAQHVVLNDLAGLAKYSRRNAAPQLGGVLKRCIASICNPLFRRPF